MRSSAVSIQAQRGALVLILGFYEKTMIRAPLALISFFTALVVSTGLIAASAWSPDSAVDAYESVSKPLPPEYMIGRNGSVTLRVCFNWSCSRREAVTFTPGDMALLTERMATCSGTSLHDRLQRVRIGIWQMELLAQARQPLIANDLAINANEETVIGRMDCVDNTSNTTAYLKILRDIGELTGWKVASPKVRNRFDVNAVHWTAVIIDSETGDPWSVDSWFRPNGHLPIVMPLRNWLDEKKGWEPPFDRLNSTPRSIHELCFTRMPDPDQSEGGWY